MSMSHLRREVFIMNASFLSKKQFSMGLMTAIGAFRPLPSIPAKVGSLNPKPAFDLGDGDYSSCP